MYDNLICRVLNYLIIHGLIDENEYEIFDYCFQIIFSALFSSVFILMWAILFKQVINTLLFFIGFFFCRTFSGGFHANNQTTCFLLTQIIFLSFILIITYYEIQRSNITIIVITLLTDLIIYFFAPVDNINKPFNKNEIKRFRFQSRLFLMIITLIVIIALIFSFYLDKVLYFILGVFSVHNWKN